MINSETSVWCICNGCSGCDDDWCVEHLTGQNARIKARELGWICNTITDCIFCIECRPHFEDFCGKYFKNEIIGSSLSNLYTTILNCNGCKQSNFYGPVSQFIEKIQKCPSTTLIKHDGNGVWEVAPTAVNTSIGECDVYINVIDHDWCHVCYAVKIVCALKTTGLPYDIVRLIMKDYLVDDVYPIRK